MLLKEKHNSPGGIRRIASSPLLSALPMLILLLQAQTASAAGQRVSGTTQLGNTLTFGKTSYAVTYGYPSTALVGSNLTVSVSLYVNNFTGQIDYALQQKLTVDLYVLTSVLNASTTLAKNATDLFPGATWGPFNLTLPLTQTDTGLAKGATTNATLSVTLADEIIYNTPTNPESAYALSTEPPMTGSMGSLIIGNQVSLTSTTTTSAPGTAVQTYLPYALLGSGAVLLVGAVFLPRGPRQPLPDKKQ